MAIGSMVVNLLANTGNFDRKIGASRSKMAGAGKSGLSMGRAIASGIRLMTAAVGAGSFTLLIKNSLEAADSLAKVSSKLGLSTQDLARFRFAAEQSGLATNTLDMALQRMTRRISEAAAGTGEAQAAIVELGLDAEKLNTAGPAKSLMAIADAMSQIENPADRLRLAFKLFDSEGAALVNMLDQGSGKLKEFARQADAAGISLDENQTAAAERANDAINRASKAFSGLATQISVLFTPAIERASDAIGTLAQTIRSGDSAALKSLINIAKFAAGYAATIFVINRVIPALVSLIRTIRAVTTTSAIAQSVIGGPAGLVKVIAGLAGGVMAVAAINAQFDTMNNELAEASANARQAADQVKNATGGIGEFARDASGDVDELNKGLEGLTRIQQRMEDLFKRGAETTKQFRTPLEVLTERAADLHDMFLNGAISGGTYQRAIAAATKEFRDATEAAEEFANAGNVEVGAAVRGTSSGRDAVVRSQRAIKQQLDLEKKQLEEQKKMTRLLSDISSNTHTPVVVQEVDI